LLLAKERTLALSGGEVYHVVIYNYSWFYWTERSEKVFDEQLPLRCSSSITLEDDVHPFQTAIRECEIARPISSSGANSNRKGIAAIYVQRRWLFALASFCISEALIGYLRFAEAKDSVYATLPRWHNIY
jgi:hypothetical protein